MLQHPRVSVVIPTYYRNDLLREAIESAEAQTYSNVEIVVVDDSGEAHAEPVAAEFGDVAYVPLAKNRGANVARTRGVRESTGTYVQLLDDDDLLYPEKIETQVALFERSADNVVVVYSGGEFDRGDTFSPAPEGRGEVLDQALALELPACITSTMLIDRDALEAVLPLPDTNGSDDNYVKIELAQQGQFEYVDEFLIWKRDLPDSRGKTVGALDSERAILERYSDLYEERASLVRNGALATIRYREGLYALDRENLWSPTAIRKFWESCRLNPRFSTGSWLLFFASLFGYPGIILALESKQWVQRLLELF